jgi:type I restriction enzyme, S subunit
MRPLQRTYLCLAMAIDMFTRTTFGSLIAEGALEIGDGYRAKNDELGGDGPIFLRAGHITDTYIDFEGAARFRADLEPRIRSKLARPGDAVITTKGNSTGRTTFVSASMPMFVYSPHLSYWRSRDTARIDGGFLRYWSKSAEFRDQLSGMKASTDMAPYLSLVDQKRLEITLPPIEHQRAMAKILGSLDDKIDLNRRMNETLEVIARALFRSWFVDFDPVRAKQQARLTGLPAHLDVLFPDSFSASEAGEIPTGWQVSTLETIVAKFETGGRPRGGVSEYATGTPSIGAESIVGLGLFDYSKTKFVPDEYYERMTKGRIESRDVLLYKDGGRPGEFEPHVTLIGDGFPFDRCSINEHVYRVRAADWFGQNLLYFWLSSNRAMEEMRTRGTGVAIPGLNSTQAKSLAILVPTAAVAGAFNNTVEPLISRLLSNCKESRILAQLRDTLLPKLVSGEIRVRDTESQTEAIA